MANLLRCFLSAAISCSLVAQAPANRYDALKQALGLSDFELMQFQQRSPAPNPFNQSEAGKAVKADWDSLRYRLLDEASRANLQVIGKVFDRYATASQSIALGLIKAEQWHGQTLCLYEYHHESELGLSETQVWQLTQLKYNGLTAKTAPRRDLAMAVLNKSQKAILIEFETALQLVSDAIECALISEPLKSETLCH